MMSSGIPLNKENLRSAFATLGSSNKVMMLNLLRFHDTAQYDALACPDVDPKSISGKDVYLNRYVPAFNEIAPKYGKSERKFVSFTLRGITEAADEGPDYWHAVALVEYESLEAFEGLVNSAEYVEKVEPHRLAALKDWKFIACA